MNFTVVFKALRFYSLKKYIFVKLINSRLFQRLTMAIDQSRSRLKATGSRYIALRKKRKSDLGSVPTLTKVGELKTRTERKLGGNKKDRVLDSNIANVLNPKTKKCVKAKILTVAENPANRHFVRRNIMTKGTIITTDKGRAKVTSRPGQEGAINAVLIE